MTDDLTIQLPDGFVATFRSDGGIAISNIDGGLHMANNIEAILVQEIARLRAAQGEPVAWIDCGEAGCKEGRCGNYHAPPTVYAAPPAQPNTIEQALQKISDFGQDQERPAKPDWLLTTTQALAKNIARRCYSDVPQFEVLDDLAGVISQIDNMTCGLERIAQPAPPLSDEQIDVIFAENHDPMQNPWVNYRRFARAIEAKLKEKNT